MFLRILPLLSTIRCRTTSGDSPCTDSQTFRRPHAVQLRHLFRHSASSFPLSNPCQLGNKLTCVGRDVSGLGSITPAPCSSMTLQAQEAGRAGGGGADLAQIRKQLVDNLAHILLARDGVRETSQ